MIAQEDDVRAPHGAGDAFAFADVQRQAVVVFVDGQAPVKTHGVLGKRGVQRPIGNERQRGGVGHMRVQDTGLAGDAVDGGVDEHRRGLDFMAAGELVALGVDQDDVVGLYFLPHQSARIEQEMIRVARQGHAEMVADAFPQSMGRRRPQRKRQIGAQRGDGFGVKERIGEMGFLVHGSLS
ncbi:hypothetical protein D9M72_368670 [compost metagenome]